MKVSFVALGGKSGEHHHYQVLFSSVIICLISSTSHGISFTQVRGCRWLVHNRQFLLYVCTVFSPFPACLNMLCLIFFKILLLGMTFFLHFFLIPSLSARSTWLFYPRLLYYPFFKILLVDHFNPTLSNYLLWWLHVLSYEKFYLNNDNKIGFLINFLAVWGLFLWPWNILKYCSLRGEEVFCLLAVYFTQYLGV